MTNSYKAAVVKVSDKPPNTTMPECTNFAIKISETNEDWEKT